MGNKTVWTDELQMVGTGSLARLYGTPNRFRVTILDWAGNGEEIDTWMMENKKPITADDIVQVAKDRGMDHHFNSEILAKQVQKLADGQLTE